MEAGVEGMNGANRFEAGYRARRGTGRLMALEREQVREAVALRARARKLLFCSAPIAVTFFLGCSFLSSFYGNEDWLSALFLFGTAAFTILHLGIIRPMEIRAKVILDSA